MSFQIESVIYFYKICLLRQKSKTLYRLHQRRFNERTDQKQSQVRKTKGKYERIQGVWYVGITAQTVPTKHRPPSPGILLRRDCEAGQDHPEA